MFSGLWYSCFGLLVDEHWLCRERAVDGMVRLVQKRKIRGRVDARGHCCVGRVSPGQLVVYLMINMYGKYGSER
jgi:hypothetical protein